MGEASGKYVSRGGLKLEAALKEFGVEPAGMVCADLGCNVGGFTDCLLQNGAAKVYAVDTGYGTLAWKLRNDPRVVVMERTNAVHVAPPAEVDRCGLVVVDLGWTRQELAVPAAVKWLAPGSVRIITLIKPHYEVEKTALSGGRHGVLTEEESKAVAERVVAAMPRWGVKVEGWMVSPIRGGGSRSGEGNVEYLAQLSRGG